MKSTLLLLPALLVTGADLAAQRIKDTLVKTDGSRIRGVEVVTLDLANIVYKKGADDLQLSGSLLDRVEWYEPPETFLRGMAFLRAGDHENARQMFGELLVQESTRAPLKIEAQFLKAKTEVLAAATDTSRATEAVAGLDSFCTDHPTNLRIPEARLLLGRAQRLAGNTAAAIAALDLVESTATTEAWGILWAVRAKYEKALAHMANGAPAEARSSFASTASAVDAALGMAGSDRDEMLTLKRMAIVGEGETYVAEENYAEAVKFYRNLGRGGSDGKDTSLGAAARAGEGQALYLDAVANNKPAALRHAQLALAEASVRDSAGGDTSAKCNYYLGMVLLALGPDKESDDFKARAVSYFDTVIQEYATTPWAAKAAAAKDQ